MTMAHSAKQDQLVVVATYRYRHEAEIGKSMLEANGVDAIINADDLGSVHPVLGAVSGIRLLVRGRDAHAARALLKE
jgi:hypothetical protein